MHQRKTEPTSFLYDCSPVRYEGRYALAEQDVQPYKDQRHMTGDGEITGHRRKGLEKWSQRNLNIILDHRD